MKVTENYGLSIYEPNDVTSYLTTYNSTMVKIDATIKSVDDQVQKNTTDLAAVEQQATSNHDEINNLTAEVSDNTTAIQGHTAQIAGQNQRLDQQDIKITAAEEKLANVGSQYRGVLTANETTLAITIGNQIDNILIDVYSSVYGLHPLTAEIRPATGGQPNLCVTTLDAQATDVNVTIKITPMAN